MITCPNCDGSGKRNWEGDGAGNHQCRMCEGRKEILEPEDVSWLANGWMGGDRYWHVAKPPNEKAERAFSIAEIMVLVAGADAVGGKLSSKAAKVRGLIQQWRGVSIDQRRR